MFSRPRQDGEGNRTVVAKEPAKRACQRVLLLPLRRTFPIWVNRRGVLPAGAVFSLVYRRMRGCIHRLGHLVQPDCAK